MMKQKINEENIENNLVFCIKPSKSICNQMNTKICFLKSVRSEQNTSVFYFG